MKKLERQQIIKQLITEYELGTQEELLEQLKKKGIDATQATISRDIREMGVIKERVSNGVIKYALFQKSKEGNSEKKLKNAIKNSMIRVDYVQFMVVVHTVMGEANVITNLLDEVSYKEILGTVSGVDTIMIMTRSELDAKIIVDQFRKIIQN